MINIKSVLAVLVVVEAVIIGVLLASHYQITLAPVSSPKSTSRKKPRGPAKKSLPAAAKAIPRVSSN